MPIRDINDPDVIKFLSETYDRTDYLRMRWNILNTDKLKQTATLNRKEKGYYDTDVLKHTMAEGMQAIARDHESGVGNKKKTPIRDAIHIPRVADIIKGHSIIDVGLGSAKEDPRLGRPDTHLTIDPVMRPMDLKQRKIIYKDIPEFGREAYIRSRNKVPPEDKYYFSESLGWTCGWRLKDSYFGKNAPTFGRVWRLTHGTKSLSGPHPDPDHYKAVEFPGPNRCPV